MSKFNSLIAAASVTLFLTAAAMPLHAAELSDAVGGLGNAAGSAVGGVTGSNSGSVNGVTGTVSNTVNGLTGDNAQTTARIGSNGELSAAARSALADGIEARARALSPRQLARLCVSAGGGAGCGSGDRSQILGIIDNRLGVLSDDQLASLCVGSGANGCGSGAGASAAAPANANSRRLSAIAGNLSSREAILYKKRCSSVLSNPRSYENDIVALCKLIK